LILAVQLFCYQFADPAPAPIDLSAINPKIEDPRPERKLLSLLDLVPHLATEK
jgi:hypothetical protein